MDTAESWDLRRVLSRQSALAWRLSTLSPLCGPCSYRQAIARMSVTPKLRSIPLCPDCQGIDIDGALRRAEEVGNRWPRPLTYRSTFDGTPRACPADILARLSRVELRARCEAAEQHHKTSRETADQEHSRYLLKHARKILRSPPGR